MLELSPETRQEIIKLAETMSNVFAPPELIPGCEVMSIADKDLYDTENGWIEAVCGRHNQQRCRWKGKFANIQVGDFVDVLYFSSIKLFEVMAKGGVGAMSTGAGWPFLHVLTIDAGGGAKYTTLALALAGAANGDTILLGAGSYSIAQTSITVAVTLRGSGVDKTIITSTDGYTLGTQAVVTFEDMTINNTGAGGGPGGKQNSVIVNDDGTDHGNVIFDNCRINCNTNRAGGSAPLYITGSAGANSIKLINGTVVTTTNSNAGSTTDYGIEIDTGIVETIGGKVTGIDQDIKINGGTVTLKYPILTNSLISGTYTGSWLSASGDIKQATGTDIFPQASVNGLNARFERLFGDDVPAKTYDFTKRQFLTDSAVVHRLGFETNANPYTFPEASWSKSGFYYFGSVNHLLFTISNAPAGGFSYVKWTNSTAKNYFGFLLALGPTGSASDALIAEVRLFSVQSPGAGDEYWSLRWIWKGSAKPDFPLQIGGWYGSGVTYSATDGTQWMTDIPYYAGLFHYHMIYILDGGTGGRISTQIYVAEGKYVTDQATTIADAGALAFPRNIKEVQFYFNENYHRAYLDDITVT